MKYFLYNVLLLSILFSSCKTHPDIHIGQTYFKEHNIFQSPANALDNVSKSDAVVLSGVYRFYLYAVEKYPALIMLNEQNKTQFLLLSDSIDVKPGDFVQLTGVPFDTLLQLDFSYSQNVKMLRPQDFIVKKDTHRVLAKAQADYQAHQQKLQQQARQPGSKLIWPNEPQWQLFVDEKRSKIITSFSDADLMYALDVNFVYDFHNYEIEQIYAGEWFKGE